MAFAFQESKVGHQHPHSHYFTMQPPCCALREPLAEIEI